MKIMLGGSIKISILNDGATTSLLRAMSLEGVHFIVGDAPGADTAFQRFLFQHGFRNVTVFCSGHARNNVGGWPAEIIRPNGVTGRTFYTKKDDAMISQADYGLFVWDKKSKGTLRNIEELRRLGKGVRVY